MVQAVRAVAGISPADQLMFIPAFGMEITAGELKATFKQLCSGGRSTTEARSSSGGACTSSGSHGGASAARAQNGEG